MRSRLLVVAALFAGATGFARANDLREMTDEARKVADALVGMVRGELVKAIETSGPLRAVVVCKYTVPEITSSVSRKTGWKVSRVSLRPRNPALGGPDIWEQAVLASFDQRQQRGEKAEALERAEVVTEPTGRYFRYMKALPVGQLCLSCHGGPENLTDAVRAQLASEYPFDRAITYKLGEVRGAVTIKRPLQ